MKLKKSVVMPEIGEWFVTATRQTIDIDIMGNQILGAYHVSLTPVKSVEKQGADLMTVEFDATKQVDLVASFPQNTLLRGQDMIRVLKSLTVAIEKRTGLIFRKEKDNG